MLVREKQSIETAIQQAWGTLTQRIANEEILARKARIESFKTDPRFLRFVEVADELGLSNPAASAWSAITSDLLPTSGYPAYLRSGMAYRETDGLHAEMVAAAGPQPEARPLYAEEVWLKLDIALNTCTMKWDTLQSPLYALFADLGGAKTLEDARLAIRSFTLALR